MQRTLVSLVLSSFAVGALAGGATGTYVGGNPQEAFLVDVVQAGNQLAGRYEEYDQRADHGSGKDRTFTLSAVIDGTHFAGQIKSLEFLGGAIPVSGNVDGVTFKLNGNADFHLVLARADQHAFQLQIAGVKATASIAKRLATVTDLTTRMESYGEQVRRRTSGLPGMEQKIIDFTAKMQSELERERSIFGDGQASGKRAQISGVIYQLNGSAYQVKNEAASTFDDFTSAVKKLRTDAVAATQTCEPVLRIDSTAPLHEACRHFEFQNSVFEQSVAETSAAFGHFKTTWFRELAAQEGIEHASDAAIR